MGGPSTSSVNQEAALSLGTAQGVAQRAPRTEADPAHVAPKGDHDTGGSKPPPAYVGTKPGELAVHHQVRRVARADWPRLIDKHAHHEAYERKVKLIHFYHVLFGHPSPEQFEKLISLVDCPALRPGDSRYMRGCDICTQTKMVDFARRPSPITKSFMLKHRPGEVLNFDGQTFGIRSWYGNYIAVINFVCVVSFKRFPFYVRSYDAPELRNALEYARRMVRLLFGVELRALHSDVFSTYYDYPVIAQWRTLHGVALDMQPPEMHYMSWLVESSNKHIMLVMRGLLPNLIGARIGGRVLTYDDTLRFWFAAHWQAVTLLDIRPNEALEQMHGHPVAPIQRATGDYSPINIYSLHTFGARCFRFVEPGDRKSKLKGTAEAGYYLGPATYCPFFRVLVSAPRSSVLITTRGTLVHAGKVEFPGEDTIGAPGEPLEWHEGEPTPELVPAPAATPSSAAGGDVPSAQGSPGTTTSSRLRTYASELPEEIVQNDDSLGTTTNSAEHTEKNATAAQGLSARQPHSLDSTSDQNDSAVTPVAQTEPPSVLRTYATEQASEPRTGNEHIQRSTNTPITSIAALVKRFVVNNSELDFRGSKHGKHADLYTRYSTATTVREFIACGGNGSHFAYDARRGLLRMRDANDQAELTRAIGAVVRSRNPTLASGFAESALSSDDRTARELRTHATTSEQLTDTRPLFTNDIAHRTVYGAYVATCSPERRTNIIETIAMCNANALGVSIEEYVHYTHGHAQTKDDNYGRDFGGFCQEEFVDHCIFHEYDEIVCHIISADDIEIDGTLIRELKGYEGESRKTMLTAIAKEIHGLCALGTFVVEPLPDGRQTISTKLVLKVKYKADGTYDKDKARLVAQGFLARAGMDFFSTFSPMAQLTGVRALFAVGTHLNTMILHSDVPQAFIQSMMDTNVFVELPKGITVKQLVGEQGKPRRGKASSRALRLVRSLYGLKQAGQLWNKELNNFLTELGFQRCDCDSCLYRFVEGNRFVLLASEVDDLVITGNHDEQIEKLHLALKEKYGISEWGPVESFLGINCKQDLEAGTFEMDVRGKIGAFFEKHPILNQAQTRATPLSATVEKEVISDTSNFDELDRFLWNNYASVVGTLIYLAITARPDIAYAVGRLSRAMHAPTAMHVKMLRQTMGYLKSHMDTKLTYRRDKNAVDEIVSGISRRGLCAVCGFTDSDYANSTEDKRRSMSGYCFYVFGCLVSWKSKLQPITADSTHAAELIAASYAANEAVWLNKMLTEIGFIFANSDVYMRTQVGPESQHVWDPDSLRVELFGDNKSAIFTSNNPRTTPQSKHLDVRYFKTRDYIEAGTLSFTYVDTSDNIADFFTKSLARPAFSRFRRFLMNLPSSFQ
jgi:hypothetical protein